MMNGKTSAAVQSGAGIMIGNNNIFSVAGYEKESKRLGKHYSEQNFSIL